MGIVRTFDCQLPADVPGYRSTEKQSIIEEKIRDNFRQAFENSLGDEEEEPEQENETEE